MICCHIEQDGRRMPQHALLRRVNSGSTAALVLGSTVQASTTSTDTG
jgi:hypothetical protein